MDISSVNRAFATAEAKRRPTFAPARRDWEMRSDARDYGARSGFYDLAVFNRRRTGTRTVCGRARALRSGDPKDRLRAVGPSFSAPSIGACHAGARRLDCHLFADACVS